MTVKGAEGRSTETSYTWNADGQQTAVSTADTTASFNYDPLGQMIDASTGGSTYSYGYDALGRRVKEEVDGSQRHFLLNGPNVVSEITDTGNRIDFTHGPWVDEVLGETLSTQSGDLQHSKFYHHDDLGSVTAWSDDSGALDGARHYSPFGAVTATQGGIEGRYGFTGRESDETGLYYYRARYYDPELGRFTSVDPVGSSFLVPRTLNGFDYAFSNPGKYRDPSGQSALSPLKKILLGVIWGAALTTAAISCVVTGAYLECILTILAAFIASPLSDQALLFALGIYVISSIALLVELGWAVVSGHIGFLPAVFIAAGVMFLSFMWLIVTLFVQGAFLDLFKTGATVDGMIAFVMAATFAAFAYWFARVVTLETEIKVG